MSIRGDIITRRTYSRIKDDGTPETWANIVDRVIRHQLWLWERVGRPNRRELEELRALLISKRGTLAGRTLWMGGTPISQSREATNFNCSALQVETVHDMVDTIWLLLQGCGVGVIPMRGTLNGFLRPIYDIQVIRSTRTDKGGRETNKETWDPESGVWTLAIGDSGEAWAKAIGKLLAGKYPAKKIVFDLDSIRTGWGLMASRVMGGSVRGTRSLPRPSPPSPVSCRGVRAPSSPASI